jgi:hypothetical protein
MDRPRHQKSLPDWIGRRHGLASLKFGRFFGELAGIVIFTLSVSAINIAPLTTSSDVSSAPGTGIIFLKA